jgi:FHA domain-containing protein
MRFALRYRHQRIALGDNGIVMGRGTGCDIVLDGDDVSRRHAKAMPTDDAVIVEDLGSHNGTFVNGERIEGPSRLGHGDVFTVGSHELRVIVDRSEDSQPPEALPSLWDYDAEDEQTMSAGTLGMRFVAGYGMLAAGMVHRAERELGKTLRDFADALLTGKPATTDLVMALRFALRLAFETRRGSWLDIALKILETDVPLSNDAFQAIEETVRAIGDPAFARRAAANLRTRGVSNEEVLTSLDGLAGDEPE